MTMINRSKWYNAFGKVVKKRFFTEDDIRDIKDMVFFLTDQEDRKEYIWKYYEHFSKKVNRIEYFVNYHKGLKEIANSKEVLEAVNELMGEESVLFKDKINYKYPGGESFEPHQDITAGWGRYTNKHVSIAIPLCDTFEENGALFFGETVNEQLTDLYTDLDLNLPYDAICTDIGDVILFDSYVPHASYENKTSDPRPILMFTYTPKSEGDYYEKYHADKFKNVPPDIYKEVTTL